MTANQIRAVRLALGVVDEEFNPGDLSDSDWQLLLLAAGVNNVCASPKIVAEQVLRHLTCSSGYFSSAGLDSMGQAGVAGDVQTEKPAVFQTVGEAVHLMR